MTWNVMYNPNLVVVVVYIFIIKLILTQNLKKKNFKPDCDLQWIKPVKCFMKTGVHIFYEIKEKKWIQYEVVNRE